MTRSNHLRRPFLRPLLWALASASLLVVVWRSGGTHPSGQMPSHPREWTSWLGQHDPLDSITVVARAIVLVLVGYLLLAAMLQLAAAAVPSRNTLRLAAALTPRFLAGSIVGVVALTATAPVGAAAPERAWPSVGTESTTNPPIMRLVAPAAASTVDPPAAPARTPTNARPTPGPATQPAPTVADSTAGPTPEGDDSESLTASTWTVANGDHLWSIAERTLTLRSGHRPDDATTADYWRRLIDANRDRLVEPADPGLIIPSQEIVLPE